MKKTGKEKMKGKSPKENSAQKGTLVISSLIGVMIVGICGVAYFSFNSGTGENKKVVTNTDAYTKTQQSAKNVAQTENKVDESVNKNNNKESVAVSELDKEEKIFASIKTSKGTIEVVLYPKLMPITVNNFIGLVQKKFYDGLTFHRVEDWVIQGGDPSGNGTGGSDKTIKLETNAKLKNNRGALAMARAQDPDSASSQFYILKKDSNFLDGQYAVFGQVTSGMEFVDEMQQGDKMIEIKVAK